jgi:two-component system sensor histidine kinase/response regulator
MPTTDTLIPEISQSAPDSAIASHVVAHMSHQIRTPLNAIVGMSHLLAKTELTPLQRDYLAKITTAGHELLGLVTDILDYSKARAGTLLIDECDFDSAGLLESVTSAAASGAARKNVNLVVELDPQLPRRVRGDRLRLHQMLQSFVSSAIELSEGDDVVLSIEAMTQDANALTARFSVLARGDGPALAQPEEIDPFAPVPPGPHQLSQAARMGLVVCQRLAHLMGGAVLIENERGRGHRFSFTVRLGIVLAAPAFQAPALRGRRALVVDDSFDSRAVLSDMLIGMSVVVTEAQSGFEAIDELRRAADDGAPFDIVYLDWHMPGMDGFQTASRIRSLGLEHAPELLIVSASGRDEVMQKAAGLGIERVLLKPVLPSALFDATIQVLAGQQAEQPAPRLIRAAAPVAQPPAALEALRGARVLVVDDNEINQLVVGAILEEVGIDVTTAGDGRQALDELGHGAYHLVLMDLQMPVMDGLAATRELRAHGSRTPVVALTASASERDRQRCLAAGMDDVLGKPIDPQQLWQSLLQWIAPRTAAAPAASAAPHANQAASPLVGVPGVDMNAGLARLRGDQVLYRSLLARFVQQHGAAAAQIQDALANGAVGQAEFLAHKIRSVACNLGLSHVDASSMALEGALSTYEPPSVVQRRLGEFAESLEQTVVALARVLGLGAHASAGRQPRELA